MIYEIVEKAAELGMGVVVYTHRRLLTGQSSGVFSSFGRQHGVMAAGYRPSLMQNVQVASIWTVNSRVYRKKSWALPAADIAIIDEAHAMTAATATRIIRDHQKRGCRVIGFTATPVGIGGHYDDLIVAGTNSQLRECGAHLWCDTYGPTDVDLRNLSRRKDDEYVRADIEQRMQLPVIAGRVIESYERLNPEGVPSVLFGPSVPGSVFMRDQFRKRGFKAEHIDHRTEDEERNDILAASAAGDVDLVCNYFVLREGLDAPWIGHAIFATAFGSLATFLQAGGRLLRNHPELGRVTLQCHGGSFHRFGSLNEDRYWQLGDTNRSIRQARQKQVQARKKEEESEIQCPQCGGWRLWGPQCPYCGLKHKRSSRVVLQTNGTLVRQEGPVVKPRYQPTSEERNCTTSLFIAARSGKMTVGQLKGMHWKKFGKPMRPVWRTTTGRRVQMPTNNSMLASEAFPWARARRR
jgi:superfamily II DNA or RNA helicase